MDHPRLPAAIIEVVPVMPPLSGSPLVELDRNRYSAPTQGHVIHEPTALHDPSPRPLAWDDIGNHHHDLSRAARMGETWRTRAYPLFPPSPDDPVEPDVPTQNAVGT